MLDFETLYSWVKELPIIDWHNHLDMKMLAEDRPLGSLYEVWVKADPYKHRAMRICGEPERLITGGNGQNARCPSGVPAVVEESDKWAAWMRTLPKLVGNPLFAWAKMEMEWLGLDPESYLHGKGENVSLADWTPSKMLAKFGVEYLSPCVGAGEPEGLQTSDGGLQKAAEAEIDVKSEVSSPKSSFQIAPSLRINAGDVVSVDILERFHAAGCRIVDISVDDVSSFADNQTIKQANNQTISIAAFAAAHGWTMLLHLGALRETSARLRAAAGPAGGFAGMRAPVDPSAVAAFLNGLETGRTGVPPVGNGQDARCPSVNGQDARCPSDARSPSMLPRTILMSLNPEAHAQLAVLAGSFVEAGMPGKVQLGPAWWWCDHEEGIRDVLEKNAAYGVLSTFVGMTTDSRSLLSFVRHDYFRRILCRWVAEKVASGAFPDDEALLRPMLENVCYRNAKGIVQTLMK